MANRKDVWITLSTGQRFYPWDPDPRKIDLRDIAHTLSQINRWGGHTRVPYSVAQHSYSVASRLRGDRRAWGLLHDATEAYMGGDIVSPIKKQIPELLLMEEGIARAIEERFGLPRGALEDPEVKEMDLQMLAWEYRDLMPPTVSESGLLFVPEPMASRTPTYGAASPLKPWKPETAECTFLDLAGACGLK